MLQDIRYALRSYRQHPGFAAIAILTLGLAIGANTAIFSVVSAVLLRGLPFRDPQRIVVLWETNPLIKGFLAERLPVALKNFEEWKARTHSFEGMGAFTDDFATLLGTGEAERVEYAHATTGMFPTLGVRPALGRLFTSGEGAPGQDHVAVLTYGFWRKHFGGSADALGKTVTLDATRYTVVGVLPRSFHLSAMWGDLDQKKVELFVPLNEHPTGLAAEWRRVHYVYARLKPHVSVSEAHAEMEALSRRLVQEYPRTDHGFGSNVSPVAYEDVGPAMSRTVLALQVAVVFVLLIACANIANLMLTRAASRSKEIAIRVALGASRTRLLRQSLTEGLLLSLAGGACGLTIGFWLMRVIMALAPVDNYHLHALRLDPMVLGFTFAAALISGLLFGSAPALYFAGQQIGALLARAGRSAGAGISQNVRKALVIAETALAVVLLVGAGLVIRSMYTLLDMNPGFQADHVLTLHVPLTLSKYNTPARVKAFCDEMLDRLAGVPGVRSVAIATGFPMLDSIQLTTFHLPGEPPDDDASAHTTDIKYVSEGYFNTLRTPILRGRGFTRQEAEDDAPVAIVNEALARQLWPGQNPLGKILVFGGTGHAETPQSVSRTVVGVTPSTHQMGLDTPARAETFVPSRTIGTMSVMVRTRGNPESLASAVSGQIAAIDKQQPVTDVQSMEQRMRDGLAERRFNMLLFGAFGALALSLAAIGIYGVLSFTVARQTHEIGIRMALGARVTNIVRMVIGQGLGLALAGIAIGAVAAIGLTRLMRNLLFGVSPDDPLTFSAGVVVLAAIALLASYVPARRAARVDPVQSLRTE
jgi:putative ABC transport system permease protein